jgi:hypothetical protein
MGAANAPGRRWQSHDQWQSWELVLRIGTINILTESWCFLLPNPETNGAACLR